MVKLPPEDHLSSSHRPQFSLASNNKLRSGQVPEIILHDTRGDDDSLDVLNSRSIHTEDKPRMRMYRSAGSEVSGVCITSAPMPPVPACARSSGIRFADIILGFTVDSHFPESRSSKAPVTPNGIRKSRRPFANGSSSPHQASRVKREQLLSGSCHGRTVTIVEHMR